MANIHKIFTESGVTYIDVPQDSGRLVVRAGPNLTTAAVFTSSGAGIFGSVDINGGTIDGTVIGGDSAAAGTFTALVASSFVSSGAAQLGSAIDGVVIENATGAFGVSNAAYIRRNSSAGDLEIYASSTTARNLIFGSSSGTESARIDSSGNVGIGVTPSYRLHVADGAVEARLQSTTNGSDATLTLFANNDGGTSLSRQLVHDPDADALILKRSGTEQLRINGSGRLLVGTTSDSLVTGADVLAVQGGSTGSAVATKVSGTAVGVSGWHVGDNSAARSAWVFYGRSGASLVGAMRFMTDDALDFLTGANAMTWSTSSTERMRLDSSGRLLLGTASSGASILRIVGLPTSFVGLSTGDIWSNAGVLTVV